MERLVTQLQVRTPAGAAFTTRADEPVTVGVPVARGIVPARAVLSLWDSTNRPVPVQVRVLDTWDDGSARWVLLDFAASVNGASATYALRVTSDEDASARLVSDALRLEHERHGVRVDTGLLRLRVVALGNALATLNWGQGKQATLSLALEDERGVPGHLRLHHTVLEQAGPLRATVALRGTVRWGTTRIEVVLRVTATRASAALRCALTLRNPAAARHRGGFWELGSGGSVMLRRATVRVTPSSCDEREVTLRLSPHGEALRGRSALVAQDSSGGPAWHSPVHRTRTGELAGMIRGFHGAVDSTALSGTRATPIVIVGSGDAQLAVAVPRFWQNFPRALRASAAGVEFDLFPQGHDAHELQGGEQKTHTFHVACGREEVASEPLGWACEPLLAHAPAAHYAGAPALPRLTPAASDDPAYAALVASALDGPESFEAKRERIDEYGWRHFGDLYADHEAVGHAGPQPLVSHYNNQYDALAAFLAWFMRTGDARWWSLASDLAAHVVDIDLYHTREDKAAYNGGMFWHTVHYLDAGLATHRAYPKAPGSPGGGPSPEHVYSTGLLLHYYMTGERASRDAVVQLANWLIDAEDGRQSRWRWVTHSDTGLTSASGSMAYHGPGRGGANTISTLLDAHRLTGHERYLAQAERIIRRCVHPEQDIAALTLHDAERRWFYTMFLQSLGKYLQHLEDRGDAGRLYDYAQATLLHYARWMAQHEEPYLVHPERLEYPNETWAAQELRKADVFRLAASHAHGDEAALFTRKAEGFFGYAVRTLEQWPTHTLTRPMVLLLSQGHTHAYRAHAGAGVPRAARERAWQDAPGAFPPQAVFVPQRTVALGRARAAVLGGAAAALVTLVCWSLM